jgi:hypothetical protein
MIKKKRALLDDRVDFVHFLELLYCHMNDTVILNRRKAAGGIDDSATGLTRSNSGAETGQTF